ncbi:DUF1127 domain-containing protein [Rhodoligotrophos defluvii]|uniref:DUF1127 domain-containing protein n=1 Tax=Rhodoligotrophos defluvii TaxID=2561934 RepID=UPI0010C99ABB|nr:DUF1127 domain-containing protein [Rhodoligotrophos defluvii]
MSALILKSLSRGAETVLLAALSAAHLAFAAYRERQERRIAELALAKLDEHLLKDLGVTRSDIQLGVLGQLEQRRDGRTHRRDF